MLVVLKAFFNHTKCKGAKVKDGDKIMCVVDDIYYDE